MAKSDEVSCCECPNRRTVLLKGTGAGVALAMLASGCGGDSSASQPSGPVKAGNASAVAVGSLRLIGSNLVLARDAAGLYAMTALCTHQGCTVQVAGNSLSCPCHDSTFDDTGAVINGPATQPLQHYQVDVATDGVITIQGAQPVASTTRTPVA